MRLRFQKGDAVAIAIVVLLAVAVALLFLPRREQTGAQVEIYRNGALVKTLPLQQDGTCTVEGNYTNVVTVHSGKVSITASDCPGQDCVHSGAISAAGRSIVCLPNAVEVRIVGKNDDVDIVVG